MGMATCERNNVLYIRCNNQPVLRVYVFVFISLLLQLPLLFIQIFGFGIVFNIREKKCIPIFCRCVLRFFFRKMIEIVLLFCIIMYFCHVFLYQKLLNSEMVWKKSRTKYKIFFPLSFSVHLVWNTVMRLYEDKITVLYRSN